MRYSIGIYCSELSFLAFCTDNTKNTVIAFVAKEGLISTVKITVKVVSKDTIFHNSPLIVCSSSTFSSTCSV